jgi:hypothetical protein
LADLEKCDAHKKGDSGFYILLFIARLPVAMFLYWLISLILVYGIVAFATHIVYQKTQHPATKNNADMLTAYNI